MVYPFHHGGRLSKISSSLSSQHHSSFLLANSSFDQFVDFDWFVDFPYSYVATNLWSYLSAASQVQPYLAMWNSYSSVLGQ